MANESTTDTTQPAAATGLVGPADAHGRALLAESALDERALMNVLDGALSADGDDVFADSAAAARAVLEQTTIADCLAREQEAAGGPMYYI